MRTHMMAFLVLELVWFVVVLMLQNQRTSEKNEIACNFTTKTYIPFSDEYFKDFIIRTNWETAEKSIEPFEKERNPRYGILSFITADDFKDEYRKHTESMLEDMLNAKYL